jgi:hypothetical protein
VSEAKETFDQSIQDAENLLRHFNSLNTKPPPPELEVLKRAGLIMAMTAWETYVEDRLLEACTRRLSEIRERGIAEFVEAKLIEEIKRLHNPDYHKTMQLFRDYAGVDLTDSWSWNNCSIKTVKEKLNGYLKLRGDIVHRSRTISPGEPSSHPVKKVDLEKAISFLRNLVDATERSFTPN